MKKQLTKWIAVIAATALAVGLETWAGKAPASGAGEIPADAVTAQGTARGMEGDVTVEVTATKDKIYAINVVSENETEGIGSIAVDHLPGTIYKYNSLAVDNVTSASVTSEAIKEAAHNALENAGIDPAPFDVPPTIEAEKEEDAEYDTDVVVVGAGGAGMTAAIVAKDAGCDVIVLESQMMVGGNTNRAEGGMNAAGTPAQQENEFDEAAGVEKQLQNAKDNFANNETVTKLAETVQKQWDEYQKNPEGYFDSPELMELDTIIGGHGINNPELVKTLAENSAGAVEWLDSIGIHLPVVGAAGGASVKRIHRPVDESGQTISVGSYIVPILKSNVDDRGIQVLTETTADQILTDDKGAVIGVHATTKGGANVTVNAKAVVLASGGFGANMDKVAEYHPEFKDFMTTNAAGAQGQGIDMAVAIGAATVDMDQIQIHPTVLFGSGGDLVTEGLRGDGAILVNQEGERFIDEVATRDVVSAAEIEQTGGYAYEIVDQKMADESKIIQNFIDNGSAVKGDTLEDLAKTLEIDPATLQSTMDTWNGYVADGKDPDYNRTSFASPLDTAPFYALKVTPGVHHTMGGVKINPSTEVLKEDGTAIPGLFAAGEVTGGVHGGNRLGGTAVADIEVFGRIAGSNAAAYAGK